MRRAPPPVLLAAALLLSAACQTEHDLYHWGTYESAVGETIHDTGGEKIPGLIRSLSADIEMAKVEGRRVGPGVHAQLGYLYYITGNPDSAALEFAQEKELYPESAVFIDGLIGRMKIKGTP